MTDTPKDDQSNDSSPAQEAGQGNTVEGARRKILRSLVLTGGVGAGSALIPTSWTRPVVEAVTLPAHAQTTGPQFVGSGPATDLTDLDDGSSFESFVESVREMVLDDAHAGEDKIKLPIPFGFCITITVVNLSDPNSPTTVNVSSNFFGADSGNGTLAELQGPGIETQLGYNVIAMPLPGGGGTGTINNVFFVLTPGPCSPLDRGGERGPVM